VNSGNVGPVQVAPRIIRDSLILREATRVDAHAIARILKESADLGLVARSDEVDPAAVSRQIEVARAAHNSLVIVAVVPHGDDDTVIGLLTLEGAPLLRLHDVARLNMAVTPAYHGKGIGKDLVQFAMERADQSGQIRKIELLVRANNEHALRLFKNLGYFEEGRLRARVRRDDGTYLDDVCMARFKPESAG